MATNSPDYSPLIIERNHPHIKTVARLEATGFSKPPVKTRDLKRIGVFGAQLCDLSAFS
jgi:hypothetical protein